MQYDNYLQKSCKAQAYFLRNAKKPDPSNYRPISLLLAISKILARDIQDKTNAFLKENNLLYNHQSGFRPNHSTNL